MIDDCIYQTTASQWEPITMDSIKEAMEKIPRVDPVSYHVYQAPWDAEKYVVLKSRCCGKTYEHHIIAGAVLEKSAIDAVFERRGKP